MISKKIIFSSNFFDNLAYIKEQAYDKKICLMIKADGYGHGMDEIVKLATGRIDVFGVSNQEEALHFRKLSKRDKVIVFGACENYALCAKEDIEVALFSYDQLKKILKSCKKAGVKPKLHLNINTGMNRFGIQSKKEFFKIISRLVKENLTLAGIYTHFSSLTTDEDYSQRQKMIFEEYANALPYDWDTCVHVGGGGSLFEDVECDMIRVGMLAYGYGNEYVKPVMAIESEIADMQYVKAGEHVGYLCGFTAREDMVVATVPLGYADGLPRLLSNNFDVKIALRKARSTGNICMDTFMVDVSHIPVQVGDKVIVMQDASYLAKICKTTPYEICTNFIKFRGESVIK